MHAPVRQSHHPADGHRFVKAATGIFLTLVVTTAFSAQDMRNAMVNYKNEIASCNSEVPKNARKACVLEAQKTLATYQRGFESYEQLLQGNTMQRCAVLKEDDRRDCESRMRGAGSADGSVAGGGILRETVTVVPSK
jgi:hypothetical protein